MPFDGIPMNYSFNDPDAADTKAYIKWECQDA